MHPGQVAPLFVVAIAIASSHGSAHADPCPESCVFSYCSTLARRDTSLYHSSPGGGLTSRSASYDATEGRVSARGSTGGDGGFYATVDARDRFTLMGPSGGGPISFTALLALSGSGSVSNPYWSVGVGGSLQEGTAPPVSVQVYNLTCCVTLNQTLLLPTQHAVGESFELKYGAFANGSGVSANANASGQLSFSDLPAGYWVISCQGYSSGPPVPTHKSTWGSLKAAFR